MKNIGAYAKSLVPLLITALYGVQSALSDGKITNTEWGGILTGVIATLGAFLVPNSKPPSAPVQVVTVTAPANANAAAPVTTTTEPAPPVL